MFRAKHPSMFSTCQKMPRRPRNLHLVTTWRSPAHDLPKTRNRTRLKVLRLPQKMTMDTSKVLHLPRKLQHIFWQRHKNIAPATQNDVQHTAKHVWIPRSATLATRNEATTRLRPPKITTSAELPIGTAIRGSHRRLRTVADGCDRERNVERTHPQPPDLQSETGTLATHSGKIVCCLKVLSYNRFCPSIRLFLFSLPLYLFGWCWIRRLGIFPSLFERNVFVFRLLSDKVKWNLCMFVPYRISLYILNSRGCNHISHHKFQRGKCCLAIPLCQSFLFYNTCSFWK